MFEKFADSSVIDKTHSDLPLSAVVQNERSKRRKKS